MSIGKSVGLTVAERAYAAVKEIRRAVEINVARLVNRDAAADGDCRARRAPAEVRRIRDAAGTRDIDIQLGDEECNAGKRRALKRNHGRRVAGKASVAGSLLEVVVPVMKTSPLRSIAIPLAWSLPLPER